MTDFIDEIQAQSMADAGLKRLKLLELCDDIGVEVGRLLESGNRQLDMQLALAWRLRERDVRAILAKSKRWGAGSHLRQLESHIRGLSEDVESQDDDENESSGPSGFDPEVLERRELIRQVMCAFAVELDLARFAPEWQQLQALATDGLVELHQEQGIGRVRVTTEGRWLIRTIAAVFDPAQRRQASGSRLV